jgi:hypothetical protein
VDPRARALLDGVLVQLAAQRGDLAGAARVGVRQARGQRSALGVDRDERGRERVHGDPGDAGGEPPLAREDVEDLLDLGGDLVGIDLGGAVGAGGERVRHLVLQTGDRPSGRVVHTAAARRGADVHCQDERVLCGAERDVVDGSGHRTPRPRDGSVWRDPSGRPAAGRGAAEGG